MATLIQGRVLSGLIRYGFPVGDSFRAPATRIFIILPDSCKKQTVLNAKPRCGRRIRLVSACFKSRPSGGVVITPCDKLWKQKSIFLKVKL